MATEVLRRRFDVEAYHRMGQAGILTEEDRVELIRFYAMGSRTVLPAFLTRGSERESVVQTLALLKARVEHPG